MIKKIVLFLLIIYPQLTIGDINHTNNNKYFHIGKMKSYDNEFTLYFKTRSKAIIAKGENSNYLNDYPQDLYLFDHLSNTDYPLITYEWFPKKIKKLFKNYSYPLFPEDFAYYLLNDNNTLILVSGKKSFNQNLQYNIKNNESLSDPSIYGNKTLSDEVNFEMSDQEVQSVIRRKVDESIISSKL